MEKVRLLVLVRMSKMQVAGRQLNRIFRETKALEYTVLTDHCLKELGIKVSFLDLKEPSQDKSMIFYRPLPKNELPPINWDEVDFSEWVEDYSGECHRVELTLGDVTARVYGQWFLNDIEQPWAHRKYVSKPYKSHAKFTRN